MIEQLLWLSGLALLAIAAIVVYGVTWSPPPRDPRRRDPAKPKGDS